MFNNEIAHKIELIVEGQEKERRQAKEIKDEEEKRKMIESWKWGKKKWHNQRI